MMKLLLTDSGIKNDSIHAALVGLLGKPISECSALIVPTALHAQRGGAVQAYRVISGREADALLVEGGDPMFLCHWMRESGLADLLPTLDETVYVGLSAGSMVMTPAIGADFVRWSPPGGGDRTLGMVDFAIFPHLDYPGMPDNSLANAEKWATTMPMRAYAIDGETAITVTDGNVEVISEGHWKLLNP
jgi:dipeptidase E